MGAIEKTVEALLKKFEGLDMYEQRRIVFWYDKEQTMSEEDLKELTIILKDKNIEVLYLKNNYFELKKIIEKDSPNLNFLVYSNKSEIDFEKNWLLDIQLYSQRFEIGKIANIKSLLEIEVPLFDAFLDKYYKFFNNSTRTTKLKNLYSSDWREKDFILGFFSVITVSNFTIDSILRSLLIEGLNEENNKYWKTIISLNLQEEFWKLIEDEYGYKSEKPTLEKLFNSFIVTHVNYKSKETISGYSNLINKNKNNSEVFISNWLRDSRDFENYKDYSYDFEKNNENLLKEQFSNKKLKDLLEVEALEFFDKVIILNIVNSLRSNESKFEIYREAILLRKGKVWYQNYKSYYEALDAAINLYELISKVQISKDNLSNLYKKYKKEFYKIDLSYRKFYLAFDQKKESDILKALRDNIENLYSNSYLEKLLEVWSLAVDDENLEQWKIGNNSNQDEFFKLYVKDFIGKNNRVVVIISDALRYEVAVELKERLNKFRGETKLNDLVGLVPSITKVGMASLLPHKNLNFKENTVFCDDISSHGTKNRSKILEKEFENSIALQYEEIVNLKRNEKRDLFKGKDIIYIYHNLIDATGDDAKKEHRVFTECETTINDIYNLINDLTGSMIVSNVIVTADHGFLYKRDTLEDIDKLSLNDFSKDLVIASSKRYLVTPQNLSIYDNIHKFKLGYTSDNCFVYLPKGILRFKTQGSGLNFVHGGLSPHEITIPVLSYKHIRSDSDLEKKQIKFGYVNVTLLNQNKKITSNIFPVSLYQTEKVSDKLRPLKCKVALWDLDEAEVKVSDEKTILINSEDSEPEKRKYNFNLTLKSNISNKRYYLRVFDEKQDKVILEVPFELDLLSGNDFDDF